MNWSNEKLGVSISNRSVINGKRRTKNQKCKYLQVAEKVDDCVFIVGLFSVAVIVPSLKGKQIIPKKLHDEG